ncbi:hypothetical protein FH972_021479 [Carpinus fangiana]|uniref:Pescadillo homolog n=1 Tax=Carpinus fangiana TaxID=176857 RepID=A0A5N6KQ23_9ROSI|nr:hypothetical protein FH972_021479 [Carpinus fangiana]
MASPPASALTRIRQQAHRPWICTHCFLQTNKQQRRSISRSHLERLKEAEEEWAARAKEIEADPQKNILRLLHQRGLVHDVTGDRKAFERLLATKRVGVYCGIDPTAPSLHVGHMLPMMATFWMYLHGYRAVALVGGATSRIGDPTGRTTDRPQMTPTEAKANLASMHYQLKKLWINVEALGRRHGYHKDRHWRKAVVNNAVWWNTIPFVDVLKYLGRGLRLGAMLAKDTVKNKIDSGSGMSFAEFSYPLLQGWDWWHLYQSQGVQVQIGGSDQFGNIAAGVEAVKYMAKTHPDPDIRQETLPAANTPFGFTVPLLTTASGAKFGKSAGNAIWLDSQMTSTFDLYGFFVGTSDDDIRLYLRMFTFLSTSEINRIYDKHMLDPSKRSAQHVLAFEFTELVHGAQAAQHAQDQHQALFANRKTPTLSALIDSHSDSPVDAIRYTDAKFDSGKETNSSNQQPMHIVLPKSVVLGQSIAKVLWSAGLVTSRSEGHRLALNSGAYIGRNPSGKEGMRDAVEFVPAKLRDPNQTWDAVIRDNPESGTMDKPGEEGLLVLRTGKWKVRLCRIVSDEKFKDLLANGEVNEPPGWREHFAEQMAERASSRNAIDKLKKAELENQRAREPYNPNEASNVADYENSGNSNHTLPSSTRSRSYADLKDIDSAKDDAWDEMVEIRPGRKAREQARHQQHQAAFELLEQQAHHHRQAAMWSMQDIRSRQQMSPKSSRFQYDITAVERRMPASAPPLFKEDGRVELRNWSRRSAPTQSRHQGIRSDITAWEETLSPYTGIGSGLRQMSRTAMKQAASEAQKHRKRLEKEGKIRRNREKILARRTRNKAGVAGVRPTKRLNTMADRVRTSIPQPQLKMAKIKKKGEHQDSYHSRLPPLMLIFLGTSGQVKNFITRTQAVRKLQISLPDFRRLCIFKGIYPREPRNKKKAAKNSTPSSTFYYTKDIQYLLHEPLLQKFREQKALAKKIGRHLGRGEVGDAARLERTHTPRMTLDHIVKERYPTFVDALRDLDDALCMLFLFANLPSTSTIPPKSIALCQRLCLEFEHYLIVSHSLRKSFLSIKGIYYQATIQGQDILWLVPYKFVQRVTGDIDFRIMGTFIEFYTTLLGFVNFRLYTSLGLIYPPKFDAASDARGAELGAFSLEGRAIDVGFSQTERGTFETKGAVLETDSEATAKAQAAANALSTAVGNDRDTDAQSAAENDPVGTEIDAFHAEGQGADILLQPTASSNTSAMLFSEHVVFLSRETPRAPLEFILKAFGCKRVGWDPLLGDGSFTTDISDPRITHQVVDRPALLLDVADDEEDDEETRDAKERARAATARVPGRTYVQPQWIWDCANAEKLLRPDLYAPGATLPPHLSPWVRLKRGAYDPTKPLNDSENVDVEMAGTSATENVEEADSLSEDEDDEVDGFDIGDGEEDDVSEGEFAVTGKKPSAASTGEDFAGFSSGGEEDVGIDATAEDQRELEAEARGASLSATKIRGILKRPNAAEKQRRADAEELERQKMMMPRRKRKLLEKMMYSNNKTDEEAQKLRAKRRRLEREAAAKAL